MKFKTLTVAAIAAATILAAPVSASTMNFVSNGSFEDQQISGSWRVFQGGDVNDWDVISGAGVEIQTNAVGSVLDTNWGNQYVELDSHNGNGGLSTGPTNSTIGQSLMLDAGRYELSFWYSPRTNGAANSADNGIEYELNTPVPTIDINPLRPAPTGVETVLLNTVEGPSGLYPFGTWTRVSEQFTVANDGTQYNLLFSATGNDNTYGGLIDNVAISAVPLPASSLLLLAGLGGLVAMRRRKTA